eukprot:3404861-Amphidinium_carterae.1
MQKFDASPAVAAVLGHAPLLQEMLQYMLERRLLGPLGLEIGVIAAASRSLRDNAVNATHVVALRMCTAAPVHQFPPLWIWSML